MAELEDGGAVSLGKEEGYTCGLPEGYSLEYLQGMGFYRDAQPNENMTLAEWNEFKGKELTGTKWKEIQTYHGFGGLKEDGVTKLQRTMQASGKAKDTRTAIISFDDAETALFNNLSDEERGAEKKRLEKAAALAFSHNKHNGFLESRAELHEGTNQIHIHVEYANVAKDFKNKNLYERAAQKLHESNKHYFRSRLQEEFEKQGCIVQPVLAHSAVQAKGAGESKERVHAREEAQNLAKTNLDADITEEELLEKVEKDVSEMQGMDTKQLAQMGKKNAYMEQKTALNKIQEGLMQYKQAQLANQIYYKNTELQMQNEKLQEQNKSKDTEIESLSGKLEEVSTKLEELENKNTDLMIQYQTMKEELESTANERDALSTENETLIAENEEMQEKTDKLQNEISELSKKAEDYDVLLDESMRIKEEKKELETNNSSLHDQVKQLQESVTSLTEKVDQKDSKIQELFEQNVQLFNKVQAMDEQIKSEQQKKEEAVKESTDKLEDLEAENEDLRGKLGEALEIIDTLQDEDQKDQGEEDDGQEL